MTGFMDNNSAEPPRRSPPKADYCCGLGSKLFRLKNIEGLQDTEENADESQLKKVLGTKDLISLGVGSCVGTGMYLVSGMVAKKSAGPAVVISYLIAGVAAMLSGLCYAELGCRVPHTTGSAYVYSYVTVGELIAFVIGWNMILEYIIGTAACACALSACLDILSNSAITNITSAWAGDGLLWGGPPDFLAFVITLLMMAIFVHGVKKSVMFNHVLNVFNLASWCIIVGVGLHLIKKENWDNFMPFGFTGVLKGAATCFYAYIGFDIIATTGEETKDPRKSLPIAVISSIFIIMLAYTSCSAIMTLMVNYQDLSAEAGLVQVWGQVDYPVVQWLVSIGALAALTVSMFGSMFPMPRIAYAMANDGLICRFLSRVNPKGVPACATVCLGLISAFCALVFSLETLVEMMSIGTLLAYTLVDACVVILRYQPNVQQRHPTFIEMLEKKPEGEDLNTIGAEADLIEKTSAVPDGFCTRVSKAVFKLISDIFIYVNVPESECTKESGKLMIKLFFGLCVCIVIFDILVVVTEEYWTQSPGIIFFTFVLIACFFGIISVLSKFPQSRYSSQGFLTPGVPMIPSLGIVINVYLMFRLSGITLIRFAVWMVIGFVIYFKYGILQSSLAADEESPEDPQEHLRRRE